MKLLFVGPLWEGSTSFQRLHAFESIGLEVMRLDSMGRVGRASIVDRLRHRLRRPLDRNNLNSRLIDAAASFKPDVIFVDSVLVTKRVTLTHSGKNAKLVFYSPDDIAAWHNSSVQLERSYELWDLFLTTKNFNVPELKERGVRRPVLIDNAFDPAIHYPMSYSEAGPEFERFDLVLVGTWELPRQESINALATQGLSIVVYGNNWVKSRLHPSISLRPAQYSRDYTRALHTGKVALCFLRKLNRDLVTTRSVEIPGSRRPMLAEKTAEHDRMFVDGNEYVSFSSNEELVECALSLLREDGRRMGLAQAGYNRCVSSGYSTVDRAREMMHLMCGN